MYQYTGIQNVFRMALIDIEIRQINEQTFSLISDISIKLDLSTTIQTKPSFFFISLFINECLDYALKVSKHERTFTFFTLMNEVFMKTEVY